MLSIPTLLVRFDIDKLSGAYGANSFEKLFTAVPLELLEGAALYDGDSAATLSGNEYVCVIGVQHLDYAKLEQIKSALESNDGFKSAANANPLVLSRQGSSEPLVLDGMIKNGELEGDGFWAKSALAGVKKRFAEAKPPQDDLAAQLAALHAANAAQLEKGGAEGEAKLAEPKAPAIPEPKPAEATASPEPAKPENAAPPQTFSATPAAAPVPPLATAPVPIPAAPASTVYNAPIKKKKKGVGLIIFGMLFAMVWSVLYGYLLFTVKNEIRDARFERENYIHRNGYIYSVSLQGSFQSEAAYLYENNSFTAAMYGKSIYPSEEEILANISGDPSAPFEAEYTVKIPKLGSIDGLRGKVMKGSTDEEKLYCFIEALEEADEYEEFTCSVSVDAYSASFDYDLMRELAEKLNREISEYSDISADDLEQMGTITPIEPNAPKLPYPATGILWSNGDNSQFGGLQFNTGPGAPTYIKIYTTDMWLVRTLFIRAGDSLTVILPKGNYYVNYATGYDWYGEELMFGDDGAYARCDQIMDIQTYDSGYEITLESVVGGNLGSVDVDRDNF